MLAHVGIEGASKRTVDSDAATRVDGLAARRLKLRVVSTEAHTHDLPRRTAIASSRSLGFQVGGAHVLVGYRSPASELAAVEPLLEHVLASVKQL